MEYQVFDINVIKKFVKQCNLILVLPIFETNQGVTILKRPQEELIN